MTQEAVLPVARSLPDAKSAGVLILSCNICHPRTPMLFQFSRVATSHCPRLAWRARISLLFARTLLSVLPISEPGTGSSDLAQEFLIRSSLRCMACARFL